MFNSLLAMVTPLPTDFVGRSQIVGNARHYGTAEQADGGGPGGRVDFGELTGGDQGLLGEGPMLSAGLGSVSNVPAVYT